MKEDAFVAAAEKAIRGDAAGAVASVATVVTTAATGQPLLGVVAGRGAEIFARGLLDSATERLKAAEQAWDSEEQEIDAMRRCLAAAMAPLSARLDELTELSKEQFLQTLRYVERNALSDPGKLDAIQTLIRDVRTRSARQGIDWTTTYKNLAREAERWLCSAERAAAVPESKRAANLIYHCGISVRTSRVLDDRFRWILEMVRMFGRDPDGPLGDQIHHAVLGVAHEEIMVSALEKSVGALSAIVQLHPNPEAFAGILDCSRSLLSMLGNTGITPFAVTRDLEDVLNGLEWADTGESIRNWEAHCERCFTVLDRSVLRRAEGLLGGLVARAVAQNDIPSPDWVFRPLDLVMPG